MKPTISLSGWHIIPNQVDMNNRAYDINLYQDTRLICRYKRTGDSKYTLDNINYMPVTRKNVSIFARTVLSVLGDRYIKGTKVEQLRGQEGYFGSLSMIAEILIWYTRAITKILDKVRSIPKGQSVVYAMITSTMFDSPRLNDTTEFILTQEGVTQQELYNMIIQDAVNNKISIKLMIIATEGVDWNISIEKFMHLYRNYTGG